jgi:hypothetical protein
MSSSVSIELLSLCDPRGAQRKPVELAPRPESLKGKKVLLLNNSQLTGHQHTYGAVLDWLNDYLRDLEGATCTFGERNLFDISREEMGEFAGEIARSGVAGVVIALCKGGMTQPSSLTAVEIERHGVPCVLICAEHGIALARETASSFAPGLPIVQVEPAKGDAAVFGKAETEAVAPKIVAGLTRKPAELVAEFRAQVPSSDISSQGAIRLADFEAPLVGTKMKLDPSQFAMDYYEKLCAADMCDGLPIIPPTEPRVAAMLSQTDRDPNAVLVADLPPSGASITIRSLAVNAVMAGCRPQYFPILVTAFEAMSDPAYRLFQGAITTHPSGNAVIVSGPLAAELDIHSGGGCMGPGFRANATIGRAVNLTIMNVTRAIPGKTDMSNFGSPAEFTYCVAESDADNPWQPLHTDLYGPEITSVTVHKCEAPHNVLDPRSGPEGFLKTIAGTAATPGGNNMTHLGQIIVFLNPDQAEMLAAASWSKRDIQEFLFETARLPQDASQRRLRPVFPPHFHELAMVPVMLSPDDVIVLVCGRGGPHAMVAIPWGLSSAINRPVSWKDGSPILTFKGRAGVQKRQQ